MFQLSGTEKVSFYLIVILVKLSALVVEHTVQLLNLDPKSSFKKLSKDFMMQH